MKIILASKSPRRKEILDSLGLSFEIVESSAKEFCNETDPAKIVEALSLQKGQNVYDQIKVNEPTTIIAADTIVVLDDKIFGKPQDRNSAFEMLKKLQNN